jgi:glutamate-ammonia-ligase adenylyltransferase
MQRSATCCAASATPARSPPTSSKCARRSPRKRARPIRGLIDIEFIAQYLQLAHAAATPGILDTSTARALEKAAGLGVLKPEDAAVLRPSVQLFHDLTQILRLCLPGAFDAKTASAGVLGLLARAADLPDFPALQAHVVETQRQVRACFVRIMGKGP